MAVVNAGGTLQFQINGTPYSVRGNFKIQPLTEEATSGRNLDGTAYFITKKIDSTIECDISDAGNLPIKAFQAFRNETLYAVLSNGKTYMMTGAVFTGTPDLNAVDGSFTVKFAGDVTEVTAQ